MLYEFPLDAEKTLKFAHAKRKDARAFRRSLKSFRGASNPKVLDAMELATLAFRRWREARSKKRVADCVEDVRDHIRNNPHAEITVLVLARAPWLKRNHVAGLCHFRRTWCNNIYIDFLTVHPSLVANRQRPIRGVGTALLYFVACVAAEIKAGALWGEATQNSAEFYRRIFAGADVSDLIYLREPDYNGFRTRIAASLDQLQKLRGSSD
jgi:hypothetical protein